MDKMQLHSFSDTNLLNSDLAQQISNILFQAVQERGHAYLVVSGGKTPIELFKLLAKSTIPWDKVTVTLADERCVGLKDADRNERLIKDFLLQSEAKAAEFLSLYDEQLDSLSSLQEVERTIAALPTFDVVILGMGEDGHTASLFPCSEELDSGLNGQAAVLLVNPQTAKHQRVSLSKKRLLDSRAIFLHLVGQKKNTVFNQAMAERDPRVMPVSAFLNAHNANIQVMYAP
jgi:6-phosphogluconolactonase